MPNIPAELADLQELLDRKEPLVDELARCVVPMTGMDGMKAMQHPLVQAVPYFELENAWLNQRLEYKKERLALAQKEGDWYTYVYLHERPWRAEALAEVLWRYSDRITGPAYNELLGDVWVDTESEQSPLWKVLWAARRGDSIYRMTEEEREAFKALPDWVTVYRGEWGPVRKSVRWSWTLSRETAKFFSVRLKPAGVRGRILKAKVCRLQIEALFLRRGEQECVINPRCKVTARTVEEVR